MIKNSEITKTRIFAWRWDFYNRNDQFLAVSEKRRNKQMLFSGSGGHCFHGGRVHFFRRCYVTRHCLFSSLFISNIFQFSYHFPRSYLHLVIARFYAARIFSTNSHTRTFFRVLKVEVDGFRIL